MDPFQMQLVSTEQDIQEVAALAKEIWEDHFTSLLGPQQVAYMVEKFQSYSALKEQLAEGYLYYKLLYQDQTVGYTGVHPENGRLFLSKLYIRREFRGQGLASQVFRFLLTLCKEQGLSAIWLTCNKHNKSSLAVYNHLGFTVIDSQEADIGGGFVMDDYILQYSL